MPHITVQMFPGRSIEQKRALVAELTRTTCAVLGCGPGAVSIILSDVAPHDWAEAGVLYSDAKAQPSE
ncbi:4-oxalocrotonate tautomerase [Methylobrevis albus]|uniref:4-oxalocrotonate tautomerase n=1 Tax=Methylobrevis albus TaxID=2793297 RepID=A0A931I4Q2_9HYPH|nr:4-oxalocrotonate tautomerase [Methylobrevis albus]MBH0238821.1 4-oxalocrotonate tautomerase [Methylobrevis albus]